MRRIQGMGFAWERMGVMGVMGMMGEFSFSYSHHSHYSHNSHPSPGEPCPHYPCLICFSILAQVSRRVTVRLKMRRLGTVSGSTQK